MLNRQVKNAIQPIHYAKPMDGETMGDRIRHQRLVKGLTQLALAQQLGVTKGAVSQWENGETINVKIPTFLKLCEILGVNGHYLWFGRAVSGPGRLSPQRRHTDSSES
jgi:transcriptional regulator with XRE-family HTH domain